SPVSGIWRRSLATLGKDLPVGSLIGVVTDAEVSDADIDNFVETFKPKA
ncbi:MAG: pyruvate dehydrogenase E2 component (dihydrolipoamide acetyltransferase), partial [Cellvibrionaceae bacterium]